MKRIAYLFMLLFTGLCSCHGEYAYDVEIKNQTGYSIDSPVFDCSFEKRTVQLEPYGSSVITLVYKEDLKRFLVSRFYTEAVLRYTVYSFSDSTGTYTGNEGRGGIIAKRGLNRTGKNTLLISKDMSPAEPDGLFLFECVH